VSAYIIKWLAVILMIIDHVGFFLFPQQIILRMIGRLSFPLFAFLIANGYQHTSDKKKFFFRLFAFANILQLPSLFMYLPVNVFYTLSFGLLSIIIFESKYSEVLKFACIGGILMIAYTLGADYGPYGVLVILVIHLFRNQYIYMALGIWGLSTLFYGYTHIQNLAALTPIIMSLYNNKKGPSMKYFFYLFYPIHMIFLDWLSGVL